MADKSQIEWTEASWTCVVGCTRVSPGCVHCYSERLCATRFADKEKYKGTAKLVVRPDGPPEPRWTNEVRCGEQYLLAPLGWKKPRRIFVNSMSDTFHEKVPFSFIDRIFGVMALCPQHTFQVLTKRTARMREYLNARYLSENIRNAAVRDAAAKWGAVTPALNERWKERNAEAIRGDIHDWPLKNVWIGTSVEDQQRADERIPELLACPAAVRWLSCEPLLGPVHIRAEHFAHPAYAGPLHWVVCGGESGPGARPMEVGWAESLREQCRGAISFFMKQGSSANWPRYKDFDSFPEDLRVREYPTPEVVNV